VHGVGWDPPEDAEGAGGGNCQAAFHHLSAFLVNWMGPRGLVRDEFPIKGQEYILLLSSQDLCVDNTMQLTLHLFSSAVIATQRKLEGVQ